MSPDEIDDFFCRRMSLFNSLPLVAVVSGFGNVKLGFPLEENTPNPHLFSTKIYKNLNKNELSEVVDSWLCFWAAHVFGERTVLQVPCRCRPSSLAHLDEFHTSFKQHGLEMRTTGSFSGKGGGNPVIFEQNLYKFCDTDGNDIIYYMFWRCLNQKEKVNIKPDDHLIETWPCAHIQILDLFPKTVETVRRIRGRMFFGTLVAEMALSSLRSGLILSP